LIVKDSKPYPSRTTFNFNEKIGPVTTYDLKVYGGGQHGPVAFEV